MKSIHIRNLDDEIIVSLKRRAARHNRSLQKEVESILADAAEMAPPQDLQAEVPKLRLHTASTGNQNSTWSRESIYGDEGR